MEPPGHSVGMKVTVAVTGFLMVLFVIVHMLGNLTIFAGYINAYAEHLRRLPPLLWGYRAVMSAAVLLHLVLGIRLTIENRAAKPEGYTPARYRSASLAGRTMIWTGLLLLAFIVYHLLQFTARITNPGISHLLDPLGRPDVERMVILSFRHGFIAGIYIFSMLMLYLHLSHGIQSFVQTLGLNSERSIPLIHVTGAVISALLLLGFAAVPITVILGVLRP